MRELALVGVIALSFGISSYNILEELNAFNVANLAVGTAALVVAGGLALRSWGRSRRGALGAPTAKALLSVLAVTGAAVLVQTLAGISGVRFDWTFEERYELAPATRKALAALPEPLDMTLYYLEGDPRIRSTYLLLGELARHREATVRKLRLDEVPEDEDRYGIGSSNSVILRSGDRWELVARPTEGALFEALSHLAARRQRVLYVTVGTGEGDLERRDDLGYSGLRSALETEGYELRPLPSALMSEVPPDADAVVVISPDRALPGTALDALRAYLEQRGGRLVAFLDPEKSNPKSGMVALLGDFGLRSPEAIIVDPTSGPIEGAGGGLSPVAFNYSEHPATRELNSNRMTFFRGARTFALHKPKPDDRLGGRVFASGESWLQESPWPPAMRIAPEKPPGARTDYYPIVVTGEYPRAGGRARIVAFGDSDFASNRFLRTLYNLDLVVNSVHWLAEREPAITLRPKGAQLLQFPIPIQNSLSALYGVGLLIPELLVVAAGLAWLRRRRG
jgi:hypothetical protein